MPINLGCLIKTRWRSPAQAGAAKSSHLSQAFSRAGERDHGDCRGALESLILLDCPGNRVSERSVVYREFLAEVSLRSFKGRLRLRSRSLIGA